MVKKVYFFLHLYQKLVRDEPSQETFLGHIWISLLYVLKQLLHTFNHNLKCNNFEWIFFLLKKHWVQFGHNASTLYSRSCRPQISYLRRLRVQSNRSTLFQHLYQLLSAIKAPEVSIETTRKENLPTIDIVQLNSKKALVREQSDLHLRKSKNSWCRRLCKTRWNLHLHLYSLSVMWVELRVALLRMSIALRAEFYFHWKYVQFTACNCYTFVASVAMCDYSIARGFLTVPVGILLNYF